MLELAFASDEETIATPTYKRYRLHDGRIAHCSQMLVFPCGVELSICNDMKVYKCQTNVSYTEEAK